MTQRYLPAGGSAVDSADGALPWSIQILQIFIASSPGITFKYRKFVVGPLERVKRGQKNAGDVPDEPGDRPTHRTTGVRTGSRSGRNRWSGNMPRRSDYAANFLAPATAIRVRRPRTVAANSPELSARA